MVNNDKLVRFMRNRGGFLMELLQDYWEELCGQSLWDQAEDVEDVKMELGKLLGEM